MANVLRRKIPSYQFSDYDVVLTEDVGTMWFLVPNPLLSEFDDWVSLSSLQDNNLINNEGLGYGIAYYDAWKSESGLYIEDYTDHVFDGMTSDPMWFSHLDEKLVSIV